MHRCVAALLLVARTAANKDCFLPVHEAAQAGDAHELSKLLDEDKYQADAEDKCNTRIRPLMLAANSGSVESVKVLLDKGASPSVAHEGNGVTPLVAAAVGGSSEMVRLLLQKRANVDQAESRNWTALCFAAQYGHHEIVDLLLASGADAGWVTAAGLTPWMLALDAQRDAGTSTEGAEASAEGADASASAESTERVAAYTHVLEALVASGAPHGEMSSVHLVGQLPLKAIAKAGAPDGAGLQSKLLGAYHFLKVVVGIDPQSIAAHESIVRLQSGKINPDGGGDDDGSVSVAQHAVGGGPMPIHAVMRDGTDGETLVLKFDTTPGTGMMWQLVGGRANGGGNGALYLRGVLPKTDSSNHLDPTNVKRWEVAVAVGGRGGTTNWIKAPKVRFVRGSEGARLAKRDAAAAAAKAANAPNAPAPPTGRLHVVKEDGEEDMRGGASGHDEL